jgi:hypothetical protein
MAVLQVSDRDQARVRTLIDLVEDRLAIASAAAVLAVGERHARRQFTSFPDQANARDIAKGGQQPWGDVHVRTAMAASHVLRSKCAIWRSTDSAMASK